MRSRIPIMAKTRLVIPRYIFTRIVLFIAVINVAIFYQPNWIYKTFYYNPRWVDDAWWSLSYPAYLVIYSLLISIFVELVFTGVSRKFKKL